MEHNVPMIRERCLSRQTDDQEWSTKHELKVVLCVYYLFYLSVSFSPIIGFLSLRNERKLPPSLSTHSIYSTAIALHARNMISTL